MEPSDAPQMVNAFEVSSDDSSRQEKKWGEIDIPVELYREMGSPESLELRVLRDDRGKVISLILNVEALKK